MPGRWWEPGLSERDVAAAILAALERGDARLDLGEGADLVARIVATEASPRALRGELLGSAALPRRGG